jgi:hypothetical protein
VIGDRGAAGERSEGLALIVGLAAVVSSVLYFATDLIELARGGFSPAQLVLTLVAEAAIPPFVIGLYAIQRPRMGRLGLVAAVGYAYSFVFFAGTVVFALVNKTSDWSALVDRLGPWVGIHGALMVIAGLVFGLAVIRSGVLPRWTGATLMVGVVLVAASAGLTDVAQTASAGVRDLAFFGMGSSLLLARLGRVRDSGSHDRSRAHTHSTGGVGVATQPSGRHTITHAQPLIENRDTVETRRHKRKGPVSRHEEELHAEG